MPEPTAFLVASASIGDSARAVELKLALGGGKERPWDRADASAAPDARHAARGARAASGPSPPKKLERARPSAQPGSRGPDHSEPWARRRRARRTRSPSSPGLDSEEEKDRQLKAKKAFEYFKETKVEEKKFDTYRQEREQLNYFWIREETLRTRRRIKVRSPRPTMFSPSSDSWPSHDAGRLFAEMPAQEQGAELQDLEEKHAVEVRSTSNASNIYCMNTRTRSRKKNERGRGFISNTNLPAPFDEAELKADRRARDSRSRRTN